jgi:hypothetical protein
MSRTHGLLAGWPRRSSQRACRQQIDKQPMHATVSRAGRQGRAGDSKAGRSPFPDHASVIPCGFEVLADKGHAQVHAAHRGVGPVGLIDMVREPA